eukprot:SAG22_NODE_15448_length_348_cov_1.281124_1_plen_28_part_10
MARAVARGAEKCSSRTSSMLSAMSVLAP